MPRFLFHVHRHFTYMSVAFSYNSETEGMLPDNEAATRQAEYMASHLGQVDPLGYVRVTDADGATIAHFPAGLPPHLGELMRRLDEQSSNEQPCFNFSENATSR